MEKDKLVMFSWQNFYLTGIQAGIQSGHCWMEMAVYNTGIHTQNMRTRKRVAMFWDWAMNHKVVNVRNGGNQNDLLDIMTLFAREDNPYPWAHFREDGGLNMALTNVSIVVPEHVFAWQPEYEGGTPISYADGAVKNLKNKLDDFDQALYDLIKSTRLAI